ncbi:MAG: M23 family metallopeptidase [Microbacterium sp.]
MASGCSSSFHYGVDLAPGCYANIYAAYSGTVKYSGMTSGYGNYISIDHGGGVGTGYGHAAERYVSAGQYVTAGQVIAAVGNTGISTGCHLHFEVYNNWSPINPTPFMAARGISV